MPRQVKRLNPLAVSRATSPGNYADGGGLYLQVSPTGTKSWTYRYAALGKSHEMGLGSINALTLAEARTRAKECRFLRATGTDPLEAKRAAAAKKKLDDASAITFDEACELYIKLHESSWRNEKHRAQWKSTLATYASPVIGALPVAAVDTGLVLKCIEPIWEEKTETANRVRGRIEAVLSWATVRGYRTGDNPARWKGHLNEALP